MYIKIHIHIAIPTYIPLSLTNIEVSYVKFETFIKDIKDIKDIKNWHMEEYKTRYYKIS